MIRVSNRRRVRRLGRQAMGAAKTRNVIAVVAIALTTVLFTSLFTIVLSINDGFQEANFRQAGGYAHGTFKSLTLDQVDALKEDPLVEDYGLRRVLGLPTQEPFQKTHVEVAYSDANNAQWTYATPTTGTLPQEGTDQAATDTRVLELLGVTPEVGARFTLTFDVDGQATTQTFTLSGWWEYDAATPASYVLVPNSRVEAVRYTEGSGKGRKERKSRKGFSLAGMAWANLGRSKGKTVITVLSLTLAVVLLNLTVTVAQGFDLEKYVSRQICTDFTLADASHFQTGGEIFNPDVAVPQEAIDAVQAQGGVTEGGKVYGRTSTVLEYVPEDYFRAARAHFPGPEGWLDQLVSLTNRNEAGLLADTAQLYGMEAFTLDQLTVLEGDLSALYEPGSHAIAAVYTDDDYGNPRMDSHWARLGDTITLRYVEEMEYVDPDTGESYGTVPPEDENYREVPKTYRDVTYTVVALVTVPSSLDYGYYGSDEFVLNSETFCQDTGTDCVMSYAYDTTDESNAAMEAFLQDYTENQNPQLDYESQGTFAAEFSGVLGMFLLLGGALSFIVGLVGVLNFFNAILTGILARRREFAVLQSIGMTGRQLKGMLIWEGVFYALSAVVFGAGLVLAMAPLMGSVETLLWFFTYHLTLVPVGILAPIFLLLGCLIPLGVYRSATRASLVERLRATED